MQYRLHSLSTRVCAVCVIQHTYFFSKMTHSLVFNLEKECKLSSEYFCYQCTFKTNSLTVFSCLGKSYMNKRTTRHEQKSPSGTYLTISKGLKVVNLTKSKGARHTSEQVRPHIRYRRGPHRWDGAPGGTCLPLPPSRAILSM